MSTTISRSIPVPIPCANDTITYKEIIRNLTANAPQPYGAIPPLMKKKKPKTKKKRPQPPVRRMSHVENWVAVDSKESIPDEDELVSSEEEKDSICI
ncbi:hypothetical protein BC941DRAFT_434142 [Chlamydoabsidia padenii]|nr:hypothetical protein BC941DRAFT_434142 [Chlamydoabsidia padenii]